MVGYTSDKACQRLHATQRGSSTIINIYLFLLWQCCNDIGIDAVTIWSRLFLQRDRCYR